jgi:serine/threonine-protein kinase
MVAEAAAGAPAALVPGSVPHLRSEIRSLLHRQIRFAALVASMVFAAFLAKDLFFENLLDEPSLLAIHVLVVVSTAAIGVIAWRRPGLGMTALRVMELTILGLVSLFFSWLHYSWLFFHGVYEYAGECHDGDLTLMAGDSCTLRWFALIIGYGLLIPNTRRRCLAVVMTLGLCPLVLSLAATLREGIVLRFGGALLEMTVWIGMAVVVAVYGSHKISQLRRQAFEARRLGPYHLKRRLGAGGMGEVYLAEHVLLKRPCAIKVIRPEQAGDSKTMARFEREVRATARLTHANTVEVFDYGHAEDGTFYYAMEYLPGLNLQELVDRYGPLPPARVVHVLRQVCAALREAHGLGMIHRDLKPSNLIVCERGGLHDVIKLVDFGLVRSADLRGDDTRLTQEGAIAGTPAYLSPEQGRGGADLDARSDLYSLGAVAWFLLLGRPPFDGATPIDVIIAHLSQAPSAPRTLRADVPEDLERVVLRCLEKDKSQRFADAASLDAALAACACTNEWTAQDAAAWWQDRTP